MNIKLEQYKIFNEAASTLSFSKAARNLFISQSAVSQAIRQLEKELNTQLFIRQSKGVTLTKEGTLLHQNISHALMLITNVENTLFNQQELKTGELIIGASDTLAQNFIMPYLVSFHHRYPNITIKMVNRTSNEIIELLKHHQIEIGFINTPFNDEALSVHHCLEIHDIFVSHQPYHHTMTLQELSQQSLILLENSASSRQYVDHHFAKHGIVLQPIIELGSHDLLLEAAKNNLGISCVIEEFSIEEINQKHIYPIHLDHPLPKRSIGYAYLSRKTLTPAALKFIELIQNDRQ